jgi:hypothetical protein
MYPSFRLSRIEAPRATRCSIALLVVAVALFGLWAQSSFASSPHAATAPIMLIDAWHAVANSR